MKGFYNMEKSNKVMVMVIIILLSLVSCAPHPQNIYPVNPEANFAFLFKYGPCFTDILDTINNTFAKTISVESSQTIPFILPNDQMTIIYQKMVEIRIFDYPDEFSIPVPTNGMIGKVTPAERYVITVRNGDITKTISWIDEIIQPTMVKANNLRDLFQLIINIIQKQPDYNKLPDRNFGCA